MSRATRHQLQPQTDHDGLSRQLAVLACKQAIRGSLEQQLTRDYEQRVRPALAKEPDCAADMEHEVRALNSYKLWSCANRASQNRMWQVLAEQIDNDYDRITQVADEVSANAPGSLDLDETLQAPDYQFAANIHGQPGGYMLNRAEHDLAAGILYEAGGNLFALGQGIGKTDSKAQRVLQYVAEQHPDLKPRRILDLGCSAGGQSTDYPAAFPDAEVHAVDLAPAMLRFARARAAALGSPVHFRQADAASTGFDAGSFDLIVSHNLFHETAAEHMPAIIQECHRLLAPGGVCIHQDVPIQLDRLEPFAQFISAWQHDNNDEAHWLDFAAADLPAMLVEAGFPADSVSSDYLQAVDGPIPWYVAVASKPADKATSSAR